MLPPAVMWVDPGGMTGIAIYYRDTGQMMAVEHEQRMACATIWSAAANGGGNMAIGWERFTINAATHKKTRAGVNTAIEVIGVCRFAAWSWNCQVLPEAQQQSPTPDERCLLEVLGWWKPGQDDAQSAAAHLVRWMLRSRNAPPAVLAAMH